MRCDRAGVRCLGGVAQLRRGVSIAVAHAHSHVPHWLLRSRRCRRTCRSRRCSKLQLLLCPPILLAISAAPLRRRGIPIICYQNSIICYQAAFVTHSAAFTRFCIHLNSLTSFLCIPTAFDPPRTSYRIRAHSKPSVARCAHLMHSGNIRQEAFTSI